MVEGAQPHAGSSTPRWIRTWHLLMVLVFGNVAVAAFLNHRVLTDEVYLSLFSVNASPIQAEDHLAITRRLERWGYLLGPVGLLARVGGTSLLVQLTLLPFQLDPGFARVLRASAWAYLVLLLGTVFHAAWLFYLPSAAITPDTLEAMPGSLAGALSGFLEPSALEDFGAVATLLRQVTVFDLGWIVVFVLALENRRDLPAIPALVSVLGVWAALTLSRWALFLYLVRAG